MMTIELRPYGHGYFALVDDEDFERINKHEWSYKKNPGENTGYAYRREGTWPINQKRIYMHREIMGTPDGLEVNHIDFDGLNNQKHNLENVTHAENMQHRQMNKNNTSGYIGVCWNKRCQKWMAQIWVDGYNKTIGRFDAPEEAARAYDAEAIKYFGKRATLNFPEEHPECYL